MSTHRLHLHRTRTHVLVPSARRAEDEVLLMYVFGWGHNDLVVHERKHNYIRDERETESRWYLMGGRRAIDEIEPN